MDESLIYLECQKSELICKAPKSYIEIEIENEKVNILERAGHGKSREIADLLKSYGLRLNARVDSPCG